jgi:hypothetical protein
LVVGGDACATSGEFVSAAVGAEGVLAIEVAVAGAGVPREPRKYPPAPITTTTTTAAAINNGVREELGFSSRSAAAG